MICCWGQTAAGKFEIRAGNFIKTAARVILRSQLDNAAVTKSCKCCNSSHPKLQVFLNPDCANCCTSLACRLTNMVTTDASAVRSALLGALLALHLLHFLFSYPNDDQPF